MSITRAARAVSLLLAVSCAANPAPDGFLPSPRDAVQDLYGGWIELTLAPAGGHEGTVAGELLAATADTVWIIPDSGRAVAIATSTVQKGRLARYRSDAGLVAGYSALGVLSTLSNGYILVFTAPAWIITGIVASSSESKSVLRDTPPLAWADLAEYARFPQGLPPGIDLAEIRPKPGAR